MFKQMKDLGLVFTEAENGKCRLTLIAEALIKGEVSFVEAMRLQLMKYQYPSATSWAGSGSIDHSFKVHPFQFMMRLLRDPRLENGLTADEIAFIVIFDAKSDDAACFEKVVNNILAYRTTGQIPADRKYLFVADEDLSATQRAEKKRDRDAFLNIGNTLCNYISLTQYVDRGIKTISIRRGKEEAVNEFIQATPKLIPNPDLTENYIRAYGRGYVAKDLRDFSRSEGSSTKAIREARIRKEYVLTALRTPITAITPDIVQSIAERTGIDEKIVERFLIQNYPHGNTDDFFMSYKELAHMGRDGARDFELATCEMFRKIFKMRAKHIGPIGNTPDVFVESDEEEYCGIIDNKAYHNGYSISGDHKRVMEIEYVPNVATYADAKYPLAFFTYIAGSFGSNINNQLTTIYQDTGVCGSAMPVDLLINFAQDYVDHGYDHRMIRSVFSVNREVKLQDLTFAN